MFSASVWVIMVDVLGVRSCQLSVAYFGAGWAARGERGKGGWCLLLSFSVPLQSVCVCCRSGRWEEGSPALFFWVAELTAFSVRPPLVPLSPEWLTGCGFPSPAALSLERTTLNARPHSAPFSLEWLTECGLLSPVAPSLPVQNLVFGEFSPSIHPSTAPLMALTRVGFSPPPAIVGLVQSMKQRSLVRR